MSLLGRFGIVHKNASHDCGLNVSKCCVVGRVVLARAALSERIVLLATHSEPTLSLIDVRR